LFREFWARLQTAIGRAKWISWVVVTWAVLTLILGFATFVWTKGYFRSKSSEEIAVEAYAKLFKDCCAKKDPPDCGKFRQAILGLAEHAPTSPTAREELRSLLVDSSEQAKTIKQQVLPAINQDIRDKMLQDLREKIIDKSNGERTTALKNLTELVVKQFTPRKVNKQLLREILGVALNDETLKDNATTLLQSLEPRAPEPKKPAPEIDKYAELIRYTEKQGLRKQAALALVEYASESELARVALREAHAKLCQADKKELVQALSSETARELLKDVKKIALTDTSPGNRKKALEELMDWLGDFKEWHPEVRLVLRQALLNKETEDVAAQCLEKLKDLERTRREIVLRAEPKQRTSTGGENLP
jgi:hypothetical protein